MERCPKCGSEDGFYLKVVETRNLYYQWDGTPDGSSEGHEIRGGKTEYCYNCNKPIRKHDQDRYQGEN